MDPWVTFLEGRRNLVRDRSQVIKTSTGRLWMYLFDLDCHVGTFNFSILNISKNPLMICHSTLFICSCQLSFQRSSILQKVHFLTVLRIRCLFWSPRPGIWDPGSGICFFPDPRSQIHIFGSLVIIFWVKSTIVLIDLAQNCIFTCSKNKIIFNFVMFVATKKR